MQQHGASPPCTLETSHLSCACEFAAAPQSRLPRPSLTGNLQVDIQAMDRAHRIGHQTKPVE
ncbi:MAG: hypothetical protein ACPIOQ_66240, partial [Promethearchaeia archaeon]